MAFAPMPLTFWLPILIRQQLAFFFSKLFDCKIRHLPEMPVGRFLKDGVLLEKKATLASLDITSYLDSRENLRKIICFNLLSCRSSLEVMSTMKSGRRIKKIKHLVPRLHLI